MPSRSSPRVPPPEAVEDPCDALLASFETGKAELVYEAATKLVKAHHELQHETSKLRFKANFGTDICHHCDGLTAGPGVLATCFQVQACNYTNIKEGTANPRHLRILESFLREDPKTP